MGLVLIGVAARTGGRIRFDASDVDLAVRRGRQGPGDLRGGGDTAVVGCVGRVLHTGATRHESRSVGGAEVRVKEFLISDLRISILSYGSDALCA